MSEKEISKGNKLINKGDVTPPSDKKPIQQQTEESLAPVAHDDGGENSKNQNQKDKSVSKGNEKVSRKGATKKKDELAKNKDKEDKSQNTLKGNSKQKSEIINETKKDDLTNNSKYGAEIIDETKKDVSTKNKKTANDDTGLQKEPVVATKDASKDGVTLKDKDKSAGKKVSKTVDASNKKKKGKPIASKKKVRALQDQELPQKKQTTLTDHFPVRRSERQLKVFAEDEKLYVLKKQILSGVEDGLEIRVLEEKGRGIFAARPFEKGSLVCEYAGELISFEEAKTRESEYEKTPEVGSYMYFFEYKNNKYCVDATKESGRMGRLLNHSKTNNNVHTKLFPIKDLPHLILVASRDIKAGEELLYDYGDHSKKSLESHPWLKK